MKRFQNAKRILSAALAAAMVLSVAAFSGCSKDSDKWKEKGYDLSVPVLGEDGWYMVFEDDFEGNSLNENIQFGEKYTGSREIWTTSPHAIRWESDDKDKPEQACWWCPEMVEVKNSNAVIHSRYEDNHTCDGDCPAKGRFTSGIETRRIAGDNNNNKGTSDELLFSQAFGYFECKVKQARVEPDAPESGYFTHLVMLSALPYVSMPAASSYTMYVKYSLSGSSKF